jgi:hypothetical protein
MEVIESPCPQCGKRLRIDAGFVGGICRCKYCGELLSVSKKNGKVRLKPADQTVYAHTMDRQQRADAPRKAPSGPRSPDDATPSSDDSLPPGSPVIVLPEGPRPTGPVPTVGGSGSRWRRPDRPPGARVPAKPPVPAPPGFVERHRALLLTAGVLLLAALAAAAAWAIFTSVATTA